MFTEDFKNTICSIQEIESIFIYILPSIMFEHFTGIGEKTVTELGPRGVLAVRHLGKVCSPISARAQGNPDLCGPEEKAALVRKSIAHEVIASRESRAKKCTPNCRVCVDNLWNLHWRFSLAYQLQAQLVSPRVILLLLTTYLQNCFFFHPASTIFNSLLSRFSTQCCLLAYANIANTTAQVFPPLLLSVWPRKSSPHHKRSSAPARTQWGFLGAQNTRMDEDEL